MLIQILMQNLRHVTAVSPSIKFWCTRALVHFSFVRVFNLGSLIILLSIIQEYGFSLLNKFYLV